MLYTGVGEPIKDVHFRRQLTVSRIKQMTRSEIETIITSPNPKQAIHSHIFEQFRLHGYDETQKSIRNYIGQSIFEKSSVITDYLESRARRNEDFQPHQIELINLTLQLDVNKLRPWSDIQKKRGLSKQVIFDILAELFICAQYHDKTKDDNRYSESIADYLDSFTNWGSSHRIYPDEPDVVCD